MHFCGQIVCFGCPLCNLNDATGGIYPLAMDRVLSLQPADPISGSVANPVQIKHLLYCLRDRAWNNTLTWEK